MGPSMPPAASSVAARALKSSSAVSSSKAVMSSSRTAWAAAVESSACGASSTPACMMRSRWSSGAVHRSTSRPEDCIVIARSTTHGSLPTRSGEWAQGIKQDPSMAEQQPYKAIFGRDPAFLQGVATQEPAVIASLLKAFGRTWAGTTPAQFEAQVREWMAVVKQPKLGVSYLDLVYQPMLELFDLLKVNGFR